MGNNHSIFDFDQNNAYNITCSFIRQLCVAETLSMAQQSRKCFKRKRIIRFYAKIDVIDEAVIDAPLMTAFNAILDEYSGVTHFWMPNLEFKPRENKRMDCEGAICDITARSHGMSAKFSVKVANIDHGKSIDLDLTGELIGTERWTFEPVEGKTKVQIRWNGATNRLLFLFYLHLQAPEKSIQNRYRKDSKY